MSGSMVPDPVVANSLSPSGSCRPLAGQECEEERNVIEVRTVERGGG